MSEIFGRYQVDVEIGGRVSFARQLTNSLHRHNYYEFCYCLSGHGEYVHGGERWSLGAGDVFVSEPDVRHEISSYGHQNLEIYFLWLVIGELAVEGRTTEGGAVSRFLRSHAIKSREKVDLSSYVKLLESGSSQTKRLIVSFALEMMHALTTSDTAPEEKGGQEFEKLFQFIDANLHRRITERELADLVGASERTLRRRFRAATGTTLQAEINHRRMRVAAHRLLSGFTVQEVATELGILDASQFHRAFTRAFGVSPKRFQMSYLPGRITSTTRP